MTEPLMILLFGVRIHQELPNFFFCQIARARGTLTRRGCAAETLAKRRENRRSYRSMRYMCSQTFHYKLYLCRCSLHRHTSIIFSFFTRVVSWVARSDLKRQNEYTRNWPGLCVCRRPIYLGIDSERVHSWRYIPRIKKKTRAINVMARC